MFSDINISQGSVATPSGCGGGICNDLFIGNFLMSNSERISKIVQYLAKLWTGGSSPKILGGGALPHQSLHHRVHFIRSPKPKKYELHTGLHLK